MVPLDGPVVPIVPLVPLPMPPPVMEAAPAVKPPFVVVDAVTAPIAGMHWLGLVGLHTRPSQQTSSMSQRAPAGAQQLRSLPQVFSPQQSLSCPQGPLPKAQQYRSAVVPVQASS
jgi:hypothetical protein